jgi:hypothetical protein
MQVWSRISIAMLAACGATPSTARPPRAAASPVAGTWADELHTVRLRPDRSAELERRQQCARVPCASATLSLGSWSTDGELTLGSGGEAVRYQLTLDEGGDVVLLAPPAGAPLRLHRQPAIELAGTAWVAPGRTLVFTVDGFERAQPCEGACADPVARDAGSWTFVEGELALEYPGASESFAALVEAGGDELVLVGPTETVRYQRRRD